MISFAKKYYYIIIPIGLTLLMMLGCPLYYDTVDDVYMQEIALSFATNSHSEHLIFLNVFYGYTLKFLYEIFPAVNWFCALYLVVANIAYIPLFKLTQKYGFQIFSVGILSGLMAFLLVRISFTALSFICVASAIMWVLDNVPKLNVKSIKHILFALVLCILGFGMRSGNTFICILLLFIPVYFFAIIKKQNSCGVIAVILAVLVCSNYGVKFINTSYKSTIPEETYFVKFNDYRAKASDNGNISYDDNQEVFREAGISENDIEIYKKFLYADRNVFKEEALKTFIETRDFDDSYDTNFGGIIIEMVKKPFVLWYILAAVCGFALMKKNRKEIFALSVFVLGAIGYLFFRRRGADHVINQISTCGIIVINYLAMQCYDGKFSVRDFMRDKKHILMSLVAVGLVGMNVCLAWGYHLFIGTSYTKTGAPVIQYINGTDEDFVYVSDAATRTNFINRKLTFNADECKHERVYNILGDWFVYSYYWYDILEETGLSQYSDSTYKALLDERVRFIASNTKNMDKIITFLNEHYGIEASYEVEKEFDNSSLVIYKFNK